MLLDPSDWSLAPRIDDVLAALPDSLRDHVSSETHSSAAELRTGVHQTVGDAVAELGELRAQLVEVVDSLGLAVGTAGHAPVRGLAPDGGLVARAPPGGLRLDARARPPRADVRAARPRRAAERRGRASPPSTACARTSRSCSRCRPTRRSGRAATPAWRPRGRRCFRPSRASASRARSGPTASTCAPSTCCSSATPFPTTRTCGGTCARSRAWAPSRSASWTRSRRSTAPRRSSRSCSRSCVSSSSTATPTPRSCTRPRCSTRTASSPRATASAPSSSIPSRAARCRSNDITAELLVLCAPHAERARLRRRSSSSSPSC